jgi:chemotaxis protein methyltransferase CheR
VSEDPAGRAQRLLTLLEQRTGIVVAEPAARLRVAALGQALGAAHPRGEEGLLRSLAAGEEPVPAWGALLELVANRQTSFFRDREQFLVLGTWLEQRARTLQRPLRLWSAACSTGEEAYSLAMLCSDRGIVAEVLGTDLQPRNLAHAVKGRYRTWALRNLSPEQRAGHFAEHGAEEAQLVESLRGQVTVRRHNRLDPADGAAPGRWDVVMLCNVLIYFSRPSAERVLRGLAGALADEGALVLGASEGILGMRVPLAPRSFRGRVHYAFAEVDPSPSGAPAPWPAPPEPASPAEAEAILPAEADGSDASSGPSTSAAATSGPLLQLLIEGHAHRLAHRLPKAQTAYQAALALAPESAEAHLFSGWVERKLGRLVEAGEALRRALFLDPALWPAAYLLAGVLQRLGDRDGQLRECRRMLVLTEPGQPPPDLLTPQPLLLLLLPSVDDARSAARALAEPLVPGRSKP